MAGDKEQVDLPGPPDELFTYPANRIVALFDDADSVQQAVADLQDNGISTEEIHVICGRQGAEKLDVTGRHHGLRGRIYRLVEHLLGDEHLMLHEHSEHLARGGYGVMVPADEQSRHVVHDVLARNGSHDAAYLDKLHWHTM